MMRKAGLLMMGFAVLAMTGCSSKGTGLSTSGLSADQVAVLTSISLAPEVASDNTYDAGTSSGYSVSPAGASPLTGIGGDGGPETNPSISSTDRRWWRSFAGRTTTFDYEFTAQDSTGRPTAAHLTVHKHFTGVFHVQWPETVVGSTGADSVIVHYVNKPLADHWVRHLWLVRVAPALNHGRAWRLVAASGVNVTSEVNDAGPQPHIQSVRVQAGSADTTFSDPAAAILWRKLWRATAGTSVTLTVTTNAPNDVVVRMHQDNRQVLTANGDNTYSGTWNVPAVPGLKHFGINALSSATLNDAAAAYHSNAWLFPHLNRGDAYGVAGN